MALIACSECGGQISSTAAACPHCGAPVSAEPAEPAAPAAEERKCEDCGTVLPEGAEACPNCGCPAEIKPAQPAPAPTPQPAYIAPAVAPARVQLGSAKLRIEETVAKKTANANAWLFFATAASFVMYIVAFVRYMDFFTNVEEYKKKWYIQLGAAIVNKKTDGKAEDFFYSCTVVKWVVICALVVAAIAFIGGLVQLSKKKRMSQCLWVFPILDIAGFWLPIGVLSGLTGFKEEIQKILDFITDKDFGTYIGISSLALVALFFISVGVVASVPKVTDFCSSCGRKIKHEGAGGICKGCGGRKFIPGFTPIPRDVVAAYPYSGETLVGKSPVRRIHVFGVVLVDIMILSLVISFVVMIGKENGFNISQLLVIVIALAIVAGISVIAFRNGASDNITVTPTSVKLISINGPGKLNVSVSQITDVLTNESGDLAVCALGRAFVFTDLSGRAQIAAALETLTSKNQMN